MAINFSAYERLVEYIKSDPMIENIINQTFEKERELVLFSRDIEMHLPKPNYLFNCFKLINEQIRFLPATAGILNEYDVDTALLFKTTHLLLLICGSGHFRNQSMGVPLNVLFETILRCENDILMKMPCAKVYHHGMEKLMKKNYDGFEIPNIALHNFYLIIKRKKMRAAQLFNSMHYLLPFATCYLTKINNFDNLGSISDQGLIAYAALSCILAKECDENKIMIGVELLSFVKSELDQTTASTAEVRLSNLSVMLRQSGDSITFFDSPLSSILIKLAKKRDTRCSALIFIFRQLSPTALCSVLTEYGERCRECFDESLYNVGFELVGTSFKDSSDQQLVTNTGIFKAYKQLLYALLGPLQGSDAVACAKVARAAVFLLRDRPLFLAEAIVEIVKEDEYLAILCRMFKNFNGQWKGHYKSINQSFISILCRSSAFNPVILNDMFEKEFISLINSINYIDLLFCMKDLVPYIKQHDNDKEDLSKGRLECLIVIIKFASNSLTDERYYIYTMRELIFENIQFGARIAFNLRDKCNFNALMARIYRNFKEEDKFLLILSKNIEVSGCWLLLRGFLHTFSMMITYNLPICLMNFFEMCKEDIEYFSAHEELEDILLSFQYMTETQFIEENTKALMRCFFYLLDRSIYEMALPYSKLSIALNVYQNIGIKLALKPCTIPALFQSLEGKIQCLIAEILMEDFKMKIQSKEVAYFCEMIAVLGNESNFTINHRTATALSRLVVQKPCFPLTKKNGHYHYGLYILEVIVKLAIQKECVRDYAITIIKRNLPRISYGRMKLTCLAFLYDLSVDRDVCFDFLITNLLEVMSSIITTDAVAALHIYVKLVKKLKTVPKEYETFIVLYALAQEKFFHTRHNDDQLESTLMTMKPYFLRYHFNILLYFNEIYDAQNYCVFEDDVLRPLPKVIVFADMHKEIYGLFLDSLESSRRIQEVVENTFKQLIDNRRKLLLPNAKYVSLVVDVLHTSYRMLKRSNADFFEDEVEYMEVLEKIKLLHSYSALQSNDHGELDKCIRLIICRLVALLELNAKENIIIRKGVNLLFAITAWYYNSIVQTCVAEGSRGKFRRQILKVVKLYNEHIDCFSFGGMAVDEANPRRPKKIRFQL